MLKKLIKHEFIAMARYFLPLYLFAIILTPVFSLIFRLGLDENNMAPIYDVIEELGNAFAAEKQRYAAKPAQPMNREQRRAQAKKNRHKPPVSYPAPPAAQMVERVNNAARRKQLLAELAALENG